MFLCSFNKIIPNYHQKLPFIWSSVFVDIDVPLLGFDDEEFYTETYGNYVHCPFKYFEQFIWSVSLVRGM